MMANVRKWTKEEIEILKRDYPKYGCTPDMIKLFGRNRKYINNKAFKLGIEYKGKKKGCYQKGNIPFNKGKKPTPETLEKLKKTWFKSGSLPHNTREDYAVSRRSDNSGGFYWYIRLGLSNWVLLHREIYKNVHNVELNDNDIIFFKDGNIDNVHPNNLGRRTQLEHIMYTSPLHNKHQELIPTKILLAKLNKTIKNAKK